MKPKKEITIYDIASKLKVSPSTVSRALNDHYSISKSTIKTVKALANEMGYRPNHLAASLRKSKSNTIGVMISWINRPFISDLISGVEEVANKAGYNVIISQSQDNVEREIKNAKALYDSRIAGLVVSLSMKTDEYTHFDSYRNNGIPIVFVDRVAEDVDSHKVIIDNFSSAYRATLHLVKQGAKNIALFAGSQMRNVYRDRELGYRKALEDSGIEICEDLVIRCQNLSFEEGVEKARMLLNLKVKPDAIFSSNDTAAVGAITYAKSQGIDIPNELMVMGFNNDPISLIVDPQLSTVSHPAINMGRIAAEQVLNHINSSEPVSPVTTTLDTEIIVRSSTNRKR